MLDAAVNVGEIVIAVSIVLGGLAALLRFFRPAVKRWLGLTLPEDVNETVRDIAEEWREEVRGLWSGAYDNHQMILDNQHVLAGLFEDLRKALAPDEPTPEEILEAFQTLAKAGIGLPEEHAD